MHWLTETHTDGYSVNWLVKEVLAEMQSRYQKIAIVETLEFGRALVLDGIIQTTEKDEFIYHEMISHIALFTHPNPRKVLVVGGGDGGTVREVLKHSAVEKAVLAEIDEQVIEVSKKYLPSISCALNDPRVEICIGDGIDYVKKHQDEFDVILVDSSDPIGPAVNLFARDFYGSIRDALKEDGIMVAQTESPLFNRELLQKVYRGLSQLFPITRTYLTAIPTYTGGFWSFTLGSGKHDPLKSIPDESSLAGMENRYYTPQVHRAAFALPRFVEELLSPED